jgi:hypothetical protein
MSIYRTENPLPKPNLLVRMVRAFFGWRMRVALRKRDQLRARIAGELRPTWMRGKNVFQLSKLARRGQRTAEREHKRRLIIGRMVRA